MAKRDVRWCTAPPHARQVHETFSCPGYGHRGSSSFFGGSAVRASTLFASLSPSGVDRLLSLAAAAVAATAVAFAAAFAVAFAFAVAAVVFGTVAAAAAAAASIKGTPSSRRALPRTSLLSFDASFRDLPIANPLVAPSRSLPVPVFSLPASRPRPRRPRERHTPPRPFGAVLFPGEAAGDFCGDRIGSLQSISASSSTTPPLVAP